jgi:DNA ligase 1
LKRFAALYKQLDASTSTTAKVAAMARYFATVPTHDAAWAAYVLSGGKVKQAVPTAVMREMACHTAGLTPWLFEESYAVTGDLAEAIAYVLPAPTQRDDTSLDVWMSERITPMRELSREAQAAAVTQAWSMLDVDERFLFVKLVGGGFRVGVSKLLVQRALAQAFGLDAKVIAQRMMGYTDAKRPPTVARFEALVTPVSSMTGTADALHDKSADHQGATPPASLSLHDQGLPYPFFLAHPLEGRVEALGDSASWIVEWKYDGIRAQIVKRAGQVHVWTRGEELVSDRYPEVVQAAAGWPDGSVLDGELLAWLPASDRPAPFALLQKRIGRLTLGKKILTEAPVVFLAYDLLELELEDLRAQPQHERRAKLEAFVARHPNASFKLSMPLVQPNGHSHDWPKSASARARSAWKASCSSDATRTTGKAASKPKAVAGGSGRSIRSPWTPCSSTHKPATVGARTSTPTTPLRYGVGSRAMRWRCKLCLRPSVRAHPLHLTACSSWPSPKPIQG